MAENTHFLMRQVVLLLHIYMIVFFCICPSAWCEWGGSKCIKHLQWSGCHCPWLKSHHLAFGYLCNRLCGRTVSMCAWGEGGNGRMFCFKGTSSDFVCDSSAWMLTLVQSSPASQWWCRKIWRSRRAPQSASARGHPPGSPEQFRGFYRVLCQEKTGVGMFVFDGESCC